ncbi:MAG: Lin0512 family protein [Pseudomonadota bacterium]
MSDLTRIMLEMGTGIVLHSGDYTKAALRAIDDAIHHSSITMFRSTGLDPASMEVEVTLAAQAPERIDMEMVKRALPFGKVVPKAVKGGLDVVDETSGEPVVIVNAGLVVRVPL